MIDKLRAATPAETFIKVKKYFSTKVLTLNGAKRDQKFE
jgi:hypothetical protein